jgi:glycosyltransferase 2 family protein
MSKKMSFLLRALFGCATFLLLFLVLHPRKIIAALAHAHLGFFCAGFALCLVGLAGRALRWMLIMRHMGLHVPYWRVLEVYTISYWFNTFMPGSMGGDLYKMYDVSRASAKKIRPAVTVLVERITGILTLLVVAVVALALFHDKVPVPPWLLALILKGGAVVSVMVLIGMLRFEACWSLASRFLPFARRLLPPERARIIGAVFEEMRQKPVLFVEAFALGLCIQVLVLATYYVLALAITDTVPGIYFFTLFPLIEITSLVPITVNGIGIKEGLLVFSLRYAEVGPAFAMGLGILFRIVAILLAVIGGVLLVIRKPSGWRTQHGS